MQNQILKDDNARLEALLDEAHSMVEQLHGNNKDNSDLYAAFEVFVDGKEETFVSEPLIEDHELLSALVFDKDAPIPRNSLTMPEDAISDLIEDAEIILAVESSTAYIS